MKLIFYFFLILSTFSCQNQENGGRPNLNEINLVQKAENYYQSGNYSIAKNYFDTLLTINRTCGEYYYKRAYCKYRLLDSEAKSDFFKAIEYNYKNKKGAFLGIGTIYRIEGKYDSAIYYCDKSLEIDPNYQKAKIIKEEILRRNIKEQQ